MRGSKQAITIQAKQNVRRDYVLGKATISSLSNSYNISRKAISDWISSEKWGEIRDMFAHEDELLVCKKQLVQLNKCIEQECDPKAMMQWVKCKQMIAELFFQAAGVPRRPIGKLPKENKGRDLSRMLEDAQEQETVIEVKPNVDGAASGGHANIASSNDMPIVDVNSASEYKAEIA